MALSIRAEDFGYGDGYLDLGGRVVSGSSILSVAIQRRVSAELLGLFLGLGACAWFFWFDGSNVSPDVALIARGGILAIVALLVAGIVREIRHNYVATLNIYQIGFFEVRGLTKAQAIEIHDVLSNSRGSSSGHPFVASSGSVE